MPGKDGRGRRIGAEKKRESVRMNGPRRPCFAKKSRSQESF
jgi:hypothetical protein